MADLAPSHGDDSDPAPSHTVVKPRVGIDLVPLARVAELLDPSTGPALHRMLSPGELKESVTPDGAADPDGIAGRLAAKEAVFKLLSTAGQTVPWLGIEILRGPGGRPELRLNGRAAELAQRAGLGPIDLSISHSGGFAVAVAAAVMDVPGAAAGNIRPVAAPTTHSRRTARKPT